MEKRGQDIIKNFQQLNTSALRRQALVIVEAGFAATEVETILGKNLSYNPKKQKLKIKNREFDLEKFKRIFCLNFGQGTSTVSDNIKLLLEGREIETINLLENQEIPEMFKDDLAICLIFDNSILFSSPVLLALKHNGAGDLELSALSKRLEKFQGGNLAKIIYPAACLSLIFSARSNNIPDIAGGPTVKDLTTNTEASAMLKNYNILEQLKLNSLRLQETPKEDKYFKNVDNILVLSPETFLQTAREKARDLGFETLASSSDAAGLPKAIASTKKGQFLFSSGGSNQMALKMLPDLEANSVMIFFSNHSGIIADRSTLIRARALGLEPKDYLEDKQAGIFFENLDEQLKVESDFELADFTIYLKG